MRNKQQGFTLLEIFVSLAIGLVLIGGVLSVFVGMKTTTKETSSMGELQENGRFAISLLTDDLLRQNFWGDLTSNLSRGLLISAAPANPAGDCVGEGLDNGSFPQGNGAFRTIWAQTVTSTSILNGCITNAVTNSDVIQIKRVVANPVAPANRETSRYYLNAGFDNAAIVQGTAAIPAVNQSRLWEYQHHIYYVREDKVGDEFVPVLMQGRLQTTSDTPISFNMLVEGIERIRYMFGVDTTGDGVINAYIAADNMLENYWDNASQIRILGVKLYVLVRSIRRDANYENDNMYQMGDISFDANGDNYRRLLFSTTVSMPNAMIRTF